MSHTRHHCKGNRRKTGSNGGYGPFENGVSTAKRMGTRLVGGKGPSGRMARLP